MFPESGVDQSLRSSIPLDKSPHRIAGMFDAIAGRYDLLNRLLSAGLDQRWRARAVDALGLKGGEVVLDLCTGTADLALALATSGGASVVGVDFAGEMLRCGNQKIHAVGVRRQVRLVRGDAMRVPMLDAAVDAATIGFGIRNVQAPADALAELNRVIRPGGRLAILEFGVPRTALLRTAYGWYFSRILPLIGKLVSRHQSAYSYLPASVETFFEPPDFCQVLTAAGFTDVRAIPLTFGVVYLYEAIKPGRSSPLKPT
jgi:demethylmenaquinone methyltransferase/2-methoxy-6-polyprenyl-1,4-benzoquinol methylase